MYETFLLNFNFNFHVWEVDLSSINTVRAYLYSPEQGVPLWLCGRGRRVQRCQTGRSSCLLQLQPEACPGCPPPPCSSLLLPPGAPAACGCAPSASPAYQSQDQHGTLLSDFLWNTRQHGRFKLCLNRLQCAINTKHADTDVKYTHMRQYEAKSTREDGSLDHGTKP